MGKRPAFACHILQPDGHSAALAAPGRFPAVKPMGMETMVYFTVDGQDVCSRVDPGSAKGPGEAMRLAANMEHMHLIDPQSGSVL